MTTSERSPTPSVLPSPSATDALVRDLERALGSASVSVDAATRRAASTDWARMSPILAPRLPAGLADVVAYPHTAEQIATVVRLAHRHRVPLTPRGKGTGNYGQAIPLYNGLVLDTSHCHQILDIGEGWVRAEAGASFVAIEAAARQSGQEIAIMPSTVGSTIGGFLSGGSGGTGSIENGSVWDGYAHALEIAPCTEEGALVTVEGQDCHPHLHAYGVTGTIATATVRLVPKRDWIALLASFASESEAIEAGRDLMRLDPLPRLVSLDEPGIVATLPTDSAMPPDKFSLRAVIDRSVRARAQALVTEHGGQNEATRPKGAGYLTSLSFNHVIHRAQKARPELCHLQARGDALVARAEEARSVLSGGLLHLDGWQPSPTPEPVGTPTFVGMLLCRFDGADALYANVRRLRELGVIIDDPHTWFLHRNLHEIRGAAKAFDPNGLLNPGKLPPHGDEGSAAESRGEPAVTEN